ncbi:MAG: hypothetical protein LBH43_11790, partial [Treponema sp.]|nr:hypothetical protein [Treponema sp.]
ETHEKDPQSLINTVKDLLRLRNNNDDLTSKPNLEILHTGNGKTANAGIPDDRSFFYKRGAFIIGLNPDAGAVKVPVLLQKIPKLVYSIGGSGFEEGFFKLEPQSLGVWKY